MRATALGALARLGRLEPADVEAALTDPAPEVRSRGAEVALTLGPGTAGGIARLLEDGAPEVVEAACFALGELGPSIAGSAGSGAISSKLAAVAREHPDPLCREAAVAAMGAIGASWGLAPILAALTDKPAVRRRAVLALAAYEGPEVEAALERALTDRDWQVRQAAEDLTGHREAPG